MATRPTESAIKSVREKLQAFLAAAAKVDPREIAHHAPALYQTMRGLFAILSMAQSKRLGRTQHQKNAGFDHSLSPDLIRLNECINRFGSRNVGRKSLPSLFKEAVRLFNELIVSDIGRGTVIVSEGNTPILRISIDGNYKCERLDDACAEDDGRTARLDKIKNALKRCGDILGKAKLDAGFKTSLAERKNAAYNGMIQLLQVVASDLAPEIIEYSQYDDADDYDETIITEGVRELCEAVFGTYSSELGACNDLLSKLRSEIGYPTDLTKEDLIEGIPPSLHRLAEWFIPTERDNVLTASDLREVATAAVNQINVHTTAVANRMERKQKAGTSEAKDNRTPDERKIIDEVKDAVEKTRAQDPKASIKGICEGILKKHPNAPFRDENQLREDYYYDMANFYGEKIPGSKAQ